MGHSWACTAGTDSPNTTPGAPSRLPPCPRSILLHVGPGSTVSPPAAHLCFLRVSSHFTLAFPPLFSRFVATVERFIFLQALLTLPPSRGSPVGAAWHHRESLPYREAGRQGFPFHFLPLCRQSSKHCFKSVEWFSKAPLAGWGA